MKQDNLNSVVFSLGYEELPEHSAVFGCVLMS